VGGMRAVEALAIRIKEIDFSVSSTKEYAKTRLSGYLHIK
jgi:hypothetical protein